MLGCVMHEILSLTVLFTVLTVPRAMKGHDMLKVGGVVGWSGNWLHFRAGVQRKSVSGRFSLCPEFGGDDPEHFQRHGK